MGEEKAEKMGFDPSVPWIQFFDAWTKAWSGAMSEAVASKSFAESMGQQIEGSLDTLTLMRRQVTDLMEQYLKHMSLATRGEVLSLAERLTRIEMRVDDLDAKSDEMLDLLKAIQGSLAAHEK